MYYDPLGGDYRLVGQGMGHASYVVKCCLDEYFGCAVPAGFLPCFEHAPQLFIVLFTTCKNGKVTLIDTRPKVLSVYVSLLENES